jgi:hypothetical protein
LHGRNGYKGRLYKSLSADLDLSEQSEETSPESEDGHSPKERRDYLLIVQCDASRWRKNLQIIWPATLVETLSGDCSTDLLLATFI